MPPAEARLSRCQASVAPPPAAADPLRRSALLAAHACALSGPQHPGPQHLQHINDPAFTIAFKCMKPAESANQPTCGRHACLTGRPAEALLRLLLSGVACSRLTDVFHASTTSVAAAATAASSDFANFLTCSKPHSKPGCCLHAERCSSVQP